MSKGDFAAAVAARLGELPGVVAVTLGGSRAQGTHRPDSDWDFAVYYRGRFEPQDLRDLGWPGDVFEVGGWGGGVFNGGAWLTVEGRQVDVHYRDLDDIEHELAEAEAGRFRVEPLMFHLAGIPTYIVLAELSLGRALLGDLPSPEYPPALRRRAHEVWWRRAERTIDYAEHSHAPAGRLTECAGLLALATVQAAHAVLAGRGRWVTNEKRLVERAGLREVDRALAGVQAEPAALLDAVRITRSLCSAATAAADPAYSTERGQDQILRNHQPR